MRWLMCSFFVCASLFLPLVSVFAEGAGSSADAAAVSIALQAPSPELPEGFGVADNDHRAPYHADSWFALGMLFSSVAIAIGLNHRSGLVRRGAYLSCALMLLMIGVLLLWLRFDGVFATFKDAVFPTDAAKPFVLTFQAMLALTGSLYMAWLALRNDEQTKAFRYANDQVRYGLVSRYLHWTTAIVFLLLIAMGILMSALPKGNELLQYTYVVHKALGFALLILVFARLFWNRKSTRPALSASLKPWESKLARLAHLSLYGMLFAFPISGYVMSTAAGKWSHFFFLDVPLLFEPSMAIARPSGLMHKVLLPYLFYLILFGHIVGALKHRYLDGDVESARRMVS